MKKETYETHTLLAQDTIFELGMCDTKYWVYIDGSRNYTTSYKGNDIAILVGKQVVNFIYDKELAISKLLKDTTKDDYEKFKKIVREHYE